MLNAVNEIQKTLDDLNREKQEIVERMKRIPHEIANEWDNVKTRKKLETEHTNYGVRLQGLDIKIEHTTQALQDATLQAHIQEYKALLVREAEIQALQEANNEKIQALQQEINRLHKENQHPHGTERSKLKGRRNAIAATHTGKQHNFEVFENEHIR